MRSIARKLDQLGPVPFLFAAVLLLPVLWLWAGPEPEGKSKWKEWSKQDTVASVQARLRMVEEYAADVATENAHLRLRVEQLEKVAGGLLPDPKEWDRIVAGGK